MQVKKKKDHYTQTAENLMAHEKSDAIKIDHLAFAFPISALRHCRKAGEIKPDIELATSYKKSFFTNNNIPQIKRVKRNGIYPKPPVIKSSQALNLEEYEAHKNMVAMLMTDFYEETLKVWVNKVLGFEISPMRGRGLHGYKDSMTLRANGLDVGFIGVGGQRDTIYFQISGTGCKHLFSHTTPFVVHHWLSKVFTVTHLSRIDLAFDDFDNNFDCDYARKAYIDGWFSTSNTNRGFKADINENHKYRYDSKMKKIFSQEMICVGSRKSIIYWRIYNKKLEQGIKQDNFSWYRSEAELKKWTVDCLLNLAATFAGLCPFAASVDLDKGIRTKAMTKAKEICLDVAARIRHVRRSAGRALGDVLEAFEGDISKTMGLILPEETGGKLGIPPTYQQLINHVTEVQHV
ncbi:replication initiation factor domain-containing protein [Pseudoalteromonas sp. NSLLW24]|uniref:replication initiation factor domain-containing protein n=1 Tax=Pseudoalteromonas sp. NSLLW24 TaxID=2792050 RepID=UPI0018CCD4BE|nr:replication initiation factor domain-containing protein [Pseudoalteromonas sp. NSLLW24]MBG9999449.1 replication initiation factor domain-containing protein [Pseudoalteromonas sp. NSLLW24]